MEWETIGHVYQNKNKILIRRGVFKNKCEFPNKKNPINIMQYYKNQIALQVFVFFCKFVPHKTIILLNYKSGIKMQHLNVYETYGYK